MIQLISKRFALVLAGIALVTLSPGVLGINHGLHLKKFPQPTKEIDPPILKPFADNKDWALIEDLDYQIGDSNVHVVVPKGFVTDFASIPPTLSAVGLSSNGTYSKAAVVHDYLYWVEICTRQQSDRLLLIAMKESGVGVTKQSEIYAGVRVFGEAAWKQNAAEKSSGMPRVIPAADMEFGPHALWKEYRLLLRERGVKRPRIDSIHGGLLDRESRERSW